MKPRAAAEDRRAAHGNLMRLEVMSMLKLAVMMVAATLALTLFVIIGYGGAPAVARSDYTSAASRCTSEFSKDLFLSCTVDANVTTLRSDAEASMANTSAAVVGELLQLSEVDQVDTLSCMLDACASTTTKALSVDDPETDLLFAHYSFGISGIAQRNRYFYLEVAFPNVDLTQDTSFQVTMMPHVRGYYYSDNTANATTTTSATMSHVDLMPDHRSQLVTVNCARNELFCQAYYFLRFTEIDFAEYRIDVLFNASEAHPLPLNGRDPQFRKTWGTTAFTNWMLGIKYFFLIVSGLTALWYNAKLASLSAREQNMEQGWVVALGVALVLFNDPFYYIEATTSGNAIKILSVLFQVTFFQLLLLFWLIALDNMRLQGSEEGMSNSTFFIPKFGFIGFFWFIQVCYYGYIKYYTNNDPTWDPLASNANFALLRVLLAFCSLVYIGWFVVLCIMSRNEFKSKRPRYKFLLVASLWMVLISFLGLGDGSLTPTPMSGGSWTSFHALFNTYVMVLMYLFAPSAATLKAAEMRNATNGDKDADPEASPALGHAGEPAADPLDVAEVDANGVDLDMA